MSKAIGMVEYRTVSSGITAADTMAKTSAVEILESNVFRVFIASRVCEKRALCSNLC